MNIKIKLSQKNIFRYVYLILIILNLITILVVFRFINTYVYETLTIDRSTLVSEQSVLTGDVNMDQFDEIYKRIADKENRKEINSARDIFN